MNAFEWLPLDHYKKCLGNCFLLYLVVEILQLVHEIAVSLRCSIKEVIWKTSQNSQISTRSSHRRCSVKRKDVFKFFSKFTEKHVCCSLFLNKVAGWKPETLRSSHWRCSLKQGALKNFVNFKGNNLLRGIFLTKVQFCGPERLLKKTPAQLLPCEIYNYFEEHL